MGRGYDTPRPAQSVEEDAPSGGSGLSLQNTFGNQYVQELLGDAQELAKTSGAGDLLDAVSPGLADWFDVRSSEDEQDAFEDYGHSQWRLERFLQRNFQLLNHQPSTKSGMFDAFYSPQSGVLDVVCRVGFDFTDGSDGGSWDSDSQRASLNPERWKAQYIEQVAQTWTQGLAATFYCQEPWWEQLAARLNIRLVQDDSQPHFVVRVDRRRIGSSDRATQRPIPGDEHLPGSVFLGPEDLEDSIHHWVNSGGKNQTYAEHEAGHMFGLGDEYYQRDESGRIVEEDKPITHSSLAGDELGETLQREESGDGMMMSGSDFLPQYSLTFLEALQVMTGLDWGLTPKSPKEIPANPYL